MNVEATLDRIPPNDLDSERALIGSVLIDDTVWMDCCSVVAARDLYGFAHQQIWETMASLVRDNRPIDVVILAEQLRIEARLDAVGGLDYIAECLNSVPTSANATHYAAIVAEKARLRRLIGACTEAIRAASDLDGSGVLSGELVGQLLACVEDTRESRVVAVSEVFHPVVDAIQERLAHPDRALGIPTGLADFDEATGGLLPESLVVVAARPGMGKSALASQMAESCAARGRPALFCSLEMSRKEIAQRMLCADSGASLFRVRSGHANEADVMMLRSSAGTLGSLPLYIDDRPNQSVADIGAAARRVKRDAGDLGMLVVDYLQLLTPDNDRLKREEQVARMTRQLKGMARLLGVPVIVLAQLNRDVDKSNNFRPRLSNLRESGAIEQDADVVVFVHREEYYRPNDAEVRGQAELIIAKQRNGPTSTVKVAWHASSVKFADLRYAGDGGWGSGKDAAAGQNKEEEFT